MSGQRYVLCPGYVRSKTDGQRHYISAGQLAKLYRVKWSDCMVYSEERLVGFSREQRERLAWLYPSPDGNYKLNKERKQP